MKKIEFNSGDQKIRGNIFYPKNLKEKNPAILFIHGWTSNQDRNFPYSIKPSELGFICMTFDLRGHGISDGKLETLSREDFMSDVVTAYDYLTGLENVDQENISVIGSSFGSYLGAILTTKRNVKNLGLRVPANYPDDGFNTPHINFAKKPETTKWRMEQLKSDRTLSLRAVHDFKGDILIVESENDELVPHQTIENYKNAIDDKLKLTSVVMKGASHSISRDSERIKEYSEILTNWLKTRIPPLIQED